jgi:hypothetical protein
MDGLLDFGPNGDKSFITLAELNSLYYSQLAKINIYINDVL